MFCRSKPAGPSRIRLPNTPSGCHSRCPKFVVQGPRRASPLEEIWPRTAQSRPGLLYQLGLGFAAACQFGTSHLNYCCLPYCWLLSPWPAAIWGPVGVEILQRSSGAWALKGGWDPKLDFFHNFPTGWYVQTLVNHWCHFPWSKITFIRTKLYHNQAEPSPSIYQDPPSIHLHPWQTYDARASKIQNPEFDSSSSEDTDVSIVLFHQFPIQ
jgi:hypothetical protein